MFVHSLYISITDQIWAYYTLCSIFKSFVEDSMNFIAIIAKLVLISQL